MGHNEALSNCCSKHCGLSWYLVGPRSLLGAEPSGHQPVQGCRDHLIALAVVVPVLVWAGLHWILGVILFVSKPPKGRARWTLRLLENKVVELGIVDRALAQGSLDHIRGRQRSDPPLRAGNRGEGQKPARPERPSDAAAEVQAPSPRAA